MSARAPASSAPRSTGRVRAILVPLALLALAAILLSGPAPFASPAAPPTVVPARVTDITPVRRPTLKPEITLAGFTYRCSDCHRLFESPAETTRSLTQHRDIVLEHGINTRCFNCHNRTNRDTYVDDWGREIPADQPQLLCAKCHGPVYRDWLHGAHGRVNGYWNPQAGPQKRLRCIECHDPHRPPFRPLAPAPPPDTLRMGDQRPVEEHGGVRDPLRVYRQPGQGSETTEPEHR